MYSRIYDQTDVPSYAVLELMLLGWSREQAELWHDIT